MSQNIKYLVCNQWGGIKLTIDGPPEYMDAQAHSPGWFSALGEGDPDTQYVDPATKEVSPKRTMSAVVPTGTTNIINLPPHTHVVINDEPVSGFVEDGILELTLEDPGLYEVMCYAPSYLPYLVEITVAL